MKKKTDSNSKAFTMLLGSLSLMGVNASIHGQNTIVIRDINPDIILNESPEVYNLDINNDNVDDFRFTRNEDTYYTPASLSFDILGLNNNRPVNFSFINFAPVSTSRLNEGDSISNKSNFYISSGDGRLIYALGDNLIQGYQWLAGTTDKYAGVKFYIGTQLHYGWIRMDVSSDLKSMTIKEVGYESSPGALIKAGSKNSASKASTIAGSKPDWYEDITVTFNKATDESNISGYRIIIVPTTLIANLKLSDLQNLASDRYTYVAKTGNNFSVLIDKDSKDYEGYELTPMYNYTAVVMSVGNATTGDAFQTGSPVILTSDLEKEFVASKIIVKGKTVQLNELPESGEFKILNSIGHEIYSNAVGTGNSEIFLDQISNGIYTLHFQSEKYQITKKVILSN
jgi:hypothetical protein